MSRLQKLLLQILCNVIWKGCKLWVYIKQIVRSDACSAVFRRSDA